jgi:hypothetical protein
MTADMTFCASPNCANQCGRKMQPEQKAFLDKNPNKPVSYSHFCCEHIYKQFLSRLGSYLLQKCTKCGYISGALPIEMFIDKCGEPEKDHEQAQPRA